jgi:SAM-dependent methyltransferase/uncharacterized protein YbaR (Trm112 family)
VKRDLVNVLCCPDCKSDLTLVDDNPATAKAVGEAAPEVESGMLICRSCAETFPIIRGVPRFVSSDQYVGSFSYEWNRWNQVQLDIANGRTESEDTFAEKTGFTKSDLRGKLVLDVGCGAGRFLDVASRWGANVIGIDLSFAVEASQRNVGGRPNVSVIQADVFRLPFREQTFDAIFSIGVLHHSRDTREAFLQLPALLRNGGDIAVWLYYYEDKVYNAASDFWRAVLRPFPASVVYAWSWLIVTLFSWLWAKPVMSRHPWGHLRRILPVNTHPDRHWRILDTFDWYSPRYQDKDCSPARVLRWCLEGNIRDVRVLDFPTSIRGTRDVANQLPLVRWSIPDLRVKRVLVFGAGAAGRHAMQLLRRVAPGCVMGIADNDPAKAGLIIEDRAVMPFDQIPRDSYDVVVIASLPGKQAIAAQLERAGLVPERDFLAVGRVEQWYSFIADDSLLAA